MKVTTHFFFIVVLFIGFAQIAMSQIIPPNPITVTGIATMYARDPLTQSLCFGDGGPGGLFQDGIAKNRCSDLNFNSYIANAFKVGVEGNRKGVILDLGTAEELKAKYAFTETVGNGQAFASIDIRNGKAQILKDYKTGDLQDLVESTSLFESFKNRESIPVKVGHIYLIRSTGRDDKDPEMYAKVLVLAYTPSESVTVRWQLMTDGQRAQITDPASPSH